MERPLEIIFAVPGLPIALPDPFAVGLGGSETAALQLAQTLAARGHQVTAFARVEATAEWSGVALEPLDAFLEDRGRRRGDLLIAERDPSLLRLLGDFRARALHIHDLLDAEMAEAVRAVLPWCARILAVSAWQAQQWRQVAPDLPADRFAVIGNAVDHDLIAAATSWTRRPDRLGILYASRPERGLDVVLEQVLPRILKLEPRATLHVAGYPIENASLQGILADAKRQCAEVYRDRVRWHGALAKRDLYRLMATCGVMLYPPPGRLDPGFADTSCVLAMEAMAAGLPIVTTDRGALPETCGPAGLRVPLKGARHAGEGQVPDRLAEAVLAALTDQGTRDAVRKVGLERAKSLTWSTVADRLLAAVEPAMTRPAPAKPPARRSARAICSGLMIATPAYGGTVATRFAKSLGGTIGLLIQHRIPFAWTTVDGVSAINFARADLAATFLEEPGYSHLLCVDADIAWEPSDVLRLLEHDLDAVGGLYRAKEPGPDRYLCRVVQGAAVDPKTSLLEVASLGFGFLLLKRAVLDRMVAAYPERRFRAWVSPGEGSRPLFDFWPTGIGDGGIPIGEDFGFCALWRQAGGRIFADLSVELVHIGATDYPGRPLEALRRASAPASARVAA